MISPWATHFAARRNTSQLVNIWTFRFHLKTRRPALILNEVNKTQILISCQRITCHQNVFSSQTLSSFRRSKSLQSTCINSVFPTAIASKFPSGRFLRDESSIGHSFLLFQVSAKRVHGIVIPSKTMIGRGFIAEPRKNAFKLK